MMLIATPVQIETWLNLFTPTARRLQQALAVVIDDGLEVRQRALDIGERFELGRTMASRLNRAVTTENPREMALLLPGRPTMMRLIERAGQICSSKDLVDELQSAYKRFLKDIAQLASSQQELAVVLGAHDPKLLREAHDRQRAAMFRAVADLTGGYVDMLSWVWIARPNTDDPSFGDALTTFGYLGLRRLGLMQPLAFSLQGATPNADDPNRRAPRKLNGDPIDTRGDGTLVRELSSNSLAAMRYIRSENVAHSIYHSEDLPQNEPVDFVIAQLMDRPMKNIMPGESRSENIGHNLTRPTKLFLGDYLVHRDMWPGIEPVVKSYDITIPDQAYPDEFWFRERLLFSEMEPISMRRLFEPPEGVSKHTELVRYTIEQGNIALEDYRAYRLVIRYPVAGEHLRVFFSRKPDQARRPDPAGAGER